MKNYDTYYMILTPEQKKKVINIARLIPSITVGRAAKIFVQCGGNEAAVSRYLYTNYGVKYGGDRN